MVRNWYASFRPGMPQEGDVPASGLAKLPQGGARLMSVPLQRIRRVQQAPRAGFGRSVDQAFMEEIGR
jgi:hypothetical protein